MKRFLAYALRVLTVVVSSHLIGCSGTRGPLVIRSDGQSVDGAAADAAPPWVPPIGIRWQAQLSGAIDTSLEVELYYLDPDIVPSSTLLGLRNRGVKIACFLSAGAFEPWREDAAEFPTLAIGNSLADYPREQWLDVRNMTVRDIMGRRIEKMSGSCDAVVPVNLNAHLIASGFDITIEDDRDYAAWLADAIHRGRMSAALSVSEDLVPALAPLFDWALVVDCLGSGCPGYRELRQAGDTVLLIEFGDASTAAETCTGAGALGFDALVKHLALDGFRIACEGA